MAASRRALLYAGAGALAAGMSPRPLRAQALHKLVFGDVSRTGASWQLLMADTAGFFAAEKLAVEFVFTGSTATVAQQLIGGSFDLATPTVETVIRAVEQGAPLTIVASSMLRLPYAFMAAPTIAKPADLRGKKIILDLPQSVLSWVWKNWSAANGLRPDDVDIVYDGSSTNRLAALIANVVVLAPVNQPLDMMALDRGYKKFIEVPTYAPARTFGFTSIATRTDWIAANGDALRAFLRAEARGIDYLYDPKNREACVSALATFAKIDPVLVRASWDYYAKLRPFARGAALPDEYVKTVADYLVATGELKGPLLSSKYVDRRFLPRV